MDTKTFLENLFYNQIFEMLYFVCIIVLCYGIFYQFKKKI